MDKKTKKVHIKIINMMMITQKMIVVTMIQVTIVTIMIQGELGILKILIMNMKVID